MELINLYDQDGKQYDLAALGLTASSLPIPPPSYTRETEKLEGQDGEITISKTLNPRLITAVFRLKKASYEDLLQGRDELHYLFGSGDSFFVEEAYRPGKRWPVQLGDWANTRINPATSRVEMPLIVETGVAESVMIKTFRFTEPTFRMKNEGTYRINMRKQEDTEFIFTGTYQNGLTIRNKTTGEVWRHNGSNAEGKTVLLKGVRSTLAGQSIFGQTNKKMLGLVPGWNEFEIEGADEGFELILRTRFYFL